ncbi:MAG: hypothetical protein ACKVQB_00335, partial [Bacteroidia bacterium]
MQSPLLKYGLIAVLFCIVILNFFKTFNLYSNPDFPYDGRNVHIGGKLWLKGENPYNDKLLNAEWDKIIIENSIESSKPPGFPDSGFIYPFWSVPMLAPYYFVTWPLVKYFIWLLSFIFLLIIVWFSYSSFKENGLSLFLYFLIIFAFKSTCVALALGQPFLFCLAALLVSWYYYQKNKDTIAGLVLGIAMVKITLCLPF